MTENLITENLKLIYLAIKKLNLSWETEDEWQDYYDAGLEGLINGANTFDLTQNIKPSTYLYKCIKNNIVRSLYLKTLPKRFNPNGRDISLEYSIYENSKDKDLLLIDTIPDTNINVEEEIQKKIQYENVLNAIEHLTISEDKKIIKYRFGLIDGKCYTYDEISKIFGVSRERVRQRTNRAIKKIKEYLSKHDKDAFIFKKTKLTKIYKEGKNNYMNNKINNLQSLNNYLFEELERLNDDKRLEENDNLDKELKRSKAITQVAGQIVQNAKVILEAKKHSDMFGDELNTFYKLDTQKEREKAFIEFKKEH